MTTRRPPALRRNDRFKTRDARNQELKTAQQAWATLLRGVTQLIEGKEWLSIVDAPSEFEFGHVNFGVGEPGDVFAAARVTGVDTAHYDIVIKDAREPLTWMTPAKLLDALRRGAWR